MIAESRITIRPVAEQDRSWMRSLLRERWAGPQIVTRGRIHQADKLPGFIGWLEDRPVSLVTYHIEGDACEIISLDALEPGRGIGSALVVAVEQAASDNGCRRLWLITTNDNTRGLRFYQKRGFRIAAIYCGAIEQTRKLKPGIPATGFDNIPIRDEIELEKELK